jgi:hypothetical protein
MTAPLREDYHRYASINLYASILDHPAQDLIILQVVVRRTACRQWTEDSPTLLELPV